MYNFGKLVIPMVCVLGVVSCNKDSNNTEPTINNQTENITIENNQTEKNTAETSQVTSADAEYVSPLPDNAPIFMVAIEKDEYPPFEYRNTHGMHVGYDFDLIRAVGEEAGFKVKINTIPFLDVLPSLNDGSNDIAISALIASKERVSKFDASSPYMVSGSNFIVNHNSQYQDDSQIIDKNVAVQQDSYHAKELKNSTSNYNLIPMKTNYLAFQTLFIGKADALYADKTMLIYYADQFPEQKVHYIPHGEQTKISIFTKKGNKEVMAKVNEGLKVIKSNGRYQEINKKWFGSNASELAAE